MAPLTDEKEFKRGVVEHVARFVGYLPDLLELIGTPRTIARAVKHAVNLVPAVRNVAASDAYDQMGDPLNNRFASILAAQEQLGERCLSLEQENFKVKAELAAAANQVVALKDETLSLRAEVELLRKRSVYLSVGLAAVFVVVLSEVAWRLIK